MSYFKIYGNKNPIAYKYVNNAVRNSLSFGRSSVCSRSFRACSLRPPPCDRSMIPLFNVYHRDDRHQTVVFSSWSTSLGLLRPCGERGQVYV